MSEEAASIEPPFAGLKVLEFANILAGPAVGQFCAELGATVVKVEHPSGGDPTRGWRLTTEGADAVSAYFSSVNRGKHSIALDFRRDAQRVQQLVGWADVVIVGFKPGDEVKFGLDYDHVRNKNPGLIYLQLTAYGTADARPGFDAILQAESGFTFLNGEATGNAVKMPVALIDLLAAHQLKEGLLLALLKRAKSGRGSYVATSLMRSAVASLANQATNYLVAETVPQRMGSEHPNIVPYGTIFETADGGAVVLAVGTEPQFSALLDVLKSPQLLDDPRYVSNADRVAHRDELNAELAALFRARRQDDLLEALHAAKVPAGRLNDMAEVFVEPEARAQLFDDGRGIRSLALVGDFEGAVDLKAAPRLDADRDTVLAMIEETH